MTERTTRQKVIFTYFAPDAHSVQVVGDFTSWQQAPVALRKLKGGVWKKAIPLPPGRHAYRLLVDGQWRDDPECRIRQPNAFGGENCVCVVDAN